MKEALNVVRQILCSIPLGLGWMFTYAWIVLGWGLKAGDEYIKAWQSFAEAAYAVLHSEESDCEDVADANDS